MIESLKAELKDLWPRNEVRYWTIEEQEALKGLLNRYGLNAVSNCIGSLQFELIDAKHARPTPNTPTQGGAQK